MEGRPSVLLVLASHGWGGAEKAVVDLANALAPACRVSVVVPAHAEYRSRLGPRVHAVWELPAGSRRNPLLLRRLAEIIREDGADIVHTHAAKASEMVYWISLLRPIRQIATKHNTRPRRVFRWVHHVTAVSEAAKASIGDRDGVVVVYNGIEAIAPPSTPKSDVFTVLGVGRLHPHKGFDTLVHAVARLPFDCSLVIAGEGKERTALEALVRDLGADERVTLLGHREDVPTLMRAAHVQVVSSRTEGFSLALAEGLQCCDVVQIGRASCRERV